MLGQASYDSGTKQTWRGWQWNRIVEHLPGYHPRIGAAALKRLCADKVAVYLPGPDDLDRPLVISKGFRNENLIAVDVCPERVKGVRKAGGIAVCGTLQETILNWPEGMPLDVVVADMCGGFNKTIQCMIPIMHSTLDVGTVVAVNLLRGRDADNSVRKTMSEVYPSSETANKHRGIHFAYGVLASVIHGDKRWPTFPLAERARISAYLMALVNPVFYNYKSGNNVYDSVVFGWPWGGSQAKVVRKEIKGYAVVNAVKSIIKTRNIRSRLSAMRAVRTQKLHRSRAAK